uniref:Olfactory receptor n=1 Tax=Gopherus evgoodei TaxID=1825980 RepID=A0A8C4WLT5_9SAUR
MKNQTTVEEFILLGLSNNRHLIIIPFVVLLLVFLLSIMGNIPVVILTLRDHHLQSPMYFFLRNFFLLEICFTYIIMPSFLYSLLTERKSISLPGCFHQLLLFFLLGFYLLAAMSFDRYIAICNPLHYTSIMTSHFCDWLVLASWLIGLGYVIVPLVLLFQLPFSGPNIINHFFCDSAALLELACTDTRLLGLLSFLLATGSILGTLAITVVSYFKVISMEMRIPSTAERQKAFPTCSSHITVISITYSSCIFVYVTPTCRSRLDLRGAVALLNNVVSPLLNPFIYSLRNKQVKEALRDALSQSAVLCCLLKSA